MKPFSKSVWIRPAACGAAGCSTVQARASFGPTVKVTRSQRVAGVNDPGETGLVEAEGRQKLALSLGIGQQCDSASIAAEITTERAPRKGS
jgi:hypothetical protein